MSETGETSETSESGTNWPTSEDEQGDSSGAELNERDAREGQVPDPNLGDIPLDDQLDPHPNDPAV